jgi:hypothetical protein
VIAALKPVGTIAIATPEVRQAFGDNPAVPMLYVADSSGKIVKTFYGAPPDLHAQIARELARLQ